MEFEVYSLGIVHASVCTSLTAKQAVKKINKVSPTGIESDWKLSEDKTFRTGEANGCECPDHPGNKHFLMVC